MPPKSAHRSVGGPPGGQLLAVDEAVADGLLRDRSRRPACRPPPGRSTCTGRCRPPGRRSPRTRRARWGRAPAPSPVGIGSTMLSALKSRAFCGSSATPLSLKKSVSVPDVAGVIGTGAGVTHLRRSDATRCRGGPGGGRRRHAAGGSEWPGGQRRVEHSGGQRRRWAVAAVCGQHGGPGCGSRRLHRLGRGGGTGKAEDAGDSRRPPLVARIRQRAGDLDHRRRSFHWGLVSRCVSQRLGQAPTVSTAPHWSPGPEPTWNQPLTGLQRNRDQPVADRRTACSYGAAITGLYPVHVTDSPRRRHRTPRSTATPRSWPGRSSAPGSRSGRTAGTFNVPNPVGSLAPRRRRRRCPPTRCSSRTCSRTRRVRACTSGIRSATSPPTSTPATTG